MALTPGTRLGPYEILSALGAGGMGEVYRARDTRLDRTVAIKILPETLAADPQFRDRFDREARTISQLTHPHICALYDVGEQQGTSFLVMEYLEGETLADRLKKGALALEDGLEVAIQIADALSTAHRHSIVHRDLKPGNVMLTKAGAKLLDFGLAKASASATHGTGLSMSPTTQANLTAKGTILGTVQYMAPEQLEGHETDARTDIFAFGAVLYEIVTGQKAFEGQSHAMLIGAILHVEPRAITTIQPLAPPALDRTVRKCLAKDPERRWQTAADLRDELQWMVEAGARAEGSTPVAVKRWGRERLAWVASAVSLNALLVVIGFARAGYFSQPPPAAGTYRSTYALPEALGFPQQPLVRPNGRFALSPDGRRLAFVGTDVNGRVQLWVRALDTVAAAPLAGTDGASYPFWSPDSRFIAFVTEDKLKRIGVSGGPTVTVSDGVAGETGAWSADDVILFDTGRGSLNRVSASGGASSPVTVLDAGPGQQIQVLPFFLPDGRHFLYTGTGGNGPADPAGVYVASLDPQEKSRLLIPGGVGAMYAQGHVVFLRGTTLMAQLFDAGRRELMGEAAPVAEGIDVAGGLARPGAYSISGTGVLAYQTLGDVRSQLLWVDRSGRPLATLGEASDQISLALSSDGAHAAVSMLDLARNTRDLWIYDVVSGLRTRFTSGAADEMFPVWSPDGSRLAYGSNQKGSLNLYQRASTGAGDEEVLLEAPGNEYATSWSPDKKFLIYFNGTGGSSRTLQDLWILPVSGAHQPTAFIQTEASEAYPQFSPDGRWVAYTSDESGRDGIYVAPFPGPGRKLPVSAAGGTRPRWRRDGRELFYLSQDNQLTAALVNSEAGAFSVGAVQTLFDAGQRTAPNGLYSPGSSYDVSADGQRFLINRAVAQRSTATITLLVNWTAGLER